MSLSSSTEPKQVHKLGQMLVVLSVSLALVFIKYKFLSDSRLVNADGVGGALSPLGGIYTLAFDFLYWPCRKVTVALASLVPYGGVVVDLSADVLAAALQNFAGLLIWQRLTNLRHRSNASAVSGASDA